MTCEVALQDVLEGPLEDSRLLECEVLETGKTLERFWDHRQMIPKELVRNAKSSFKLASIGRAQERFC